MLVIALTILPVFALILAGYLARRARLLGPQAGTEINKFVVYLALPALLFNVTARTPLADLWQPGLLGTFFISALIIGGIVTAIQKLRQKHLADAVIDGLNACYPNSVYLGLPVAMLLLGPSVLAPVSLLGAVSVAGLVIFAVLIIEIGQNAAHPPLVMIRKIGRSLLRNPLFISPLLGTLWSASGLTMADSIANGLSLLAAAASPCALVALGLFLAQPNAADDKADSPSTARQSPWRDVTGLTLMKLIGQPIIAAVFAFFVFDLPKDIAILSVLAAAMPTGTGPLMVAELYRRDMYVTSGTVAASTILAVITLSICAVLLGVTPSAL